MTDYTRMPATEIAAAIAAGRTTASAVMAAHLDRISLRDQRVGAFEYLDTGRAMERARKADDLPTDARGPLHGVPFAIKDIIDTADMPTEWGSEIHAGRQPATDATCVRLFRDAGAIPLGKTVTTEFAYFRPGRTANPNNLAHTPGGSSSGSAAAVADFMVPLAFGSQTAASLVRPAAYCGTCAFRPTTGGFDLGGVMGLSPSLDTLGVMARSVADLKLCRAILTGTRETVRQEPENRPPRIGFMPGPHWQEGSQAMRDVCRMAMANLEKRGAPAREIPYPAAFENLADAHQIVMAYEAARTRIGEFNVHRDKISRQFASLMEDGLRITDVAYHETLAVRDLATGQFEALFPEFDAILVPSAGGAAPAGLEATGDPLYSRSWNLMRVPCVALPVARTQDNLPLGIQLLSRRGDDSRLLQVAGWVEATFENCKPDLDRHGVAE